MFDALLPPQPHPLLRCGCGVFLGCGIDGCAINRGTGRMIWVPPGLITAGGLGRTDLFSERESMIRSLPFCRIGDYIIFSSERGRSFLQENHHSSRSNPPFASANILKDLESQRQPLLWYFNGLNGTIPDGVSRREVCSWLLDEGCGLDCNRRDSLSIIRK